MFLRLMLFPLHIKITTNSKPAVIKFKVYTPYGISSHYFAFHFKLLQVCQFHSPTNLVHIQFILGRKILYLWVMKQQLPLGLCLYFETSDQLYDK